MTKVSPATISQIGKILVNYKICRDPHPLSDAINRKSDVLTLNEFELLVNEVPRGTRPSNVKQLKAILTMEIPMIYPENLKFAKYNYSVKLFGYADGKAVLSSFHLDYDSNINDVKYTHPLFHLTYGGKIMDNTNIGDVLLLPTPRIPFPPLDIALGIDFVLANFLTKTTYKKLLTESVYRKALKEAQERCWKPYFLTIANHWCKCSNVDFGKATDYQPTLI